MPLSKLIEVERIFTEPFLNITIDCNDGFIQQYKPDDLCVVVDYYNYANGAGGYEMECNFTTGEHTWEMMWEGNDLVVYVIFSNYKFKNPQFNFDEKIFKLNVDDIDPVNKICFINKITVVPKEQCLDIFGPNSGEENVPTLLEI